jgi:hypothetical protein
VSSLKLAESLKAEFNVWYLDDGSIGGDVETLVNDLETIRGEGYKIGLVLNERKSEIVSDDVSVVARLQAVMPGVRHVSLARL